SALLSVQIVANRDDFRSAEFIPPERELRQHALDNSPTLFVDQPSCGLKPALLWLRLRRAVFFAVHSSSAIEGGSTGKSAEYGRKTKLVWLVFRICGTTESKERTRLA